MILVVFGPKTLLFWWTLRDSLLNVSVGVYGGGGSSSRVYGSRIGVSGSYGSRIVCPMTENKMEKLEKFYGSWDYVVADLGFPNICGVQFWQSWQ